MAHTNLLPRVTWKLLNLFTLIGIALIGTETSSLAQAGKIPTEQIKEEQAYSIGLIAAVWGRPLIEYMNTTYTAVKAGASNINYFHKFENVKTAADRYVVTPNNVTIDGYCAGDLRKEPIVINVPALLKPRWYIVQVGNMFDEVVYDIGGYKGEETGLFILTGPDYQGPIPYGMKEIKINTQMAIIALRVFTSGPTDLSEARQVQSGFHVMPLSVFQQTGLRYKTPKNNLTEYEFISKAPKNLEMYDRLGFAMNLFLSKNAEYDNPLVSLFHTIGLSVNQGFSYQDLDEATKKGLIRAATTAEQVIDEAYENSAEKVNGWRYTNGAGRAGYNIALRAAMAKYVLGANIPEQSMYPNCNTDNNNNPLSGNNKYILHLNSNQIPPVSVFWNLNMYDDKSFFIENDLKRYSIGSTTDGLKKNSDGSIEIYIQKESPGTEKESNWLPAPAGKFNLTMRMYGAQSSVLDGTYRLPAVNIVR